MDLIRHGDRTPTDSIPKAPYDWTQGLGQLTATGMHQEFKLGAGLREKYVDQYHLLSPHYTIGEIYVRSTDYERTLMSAESFLTGLYPPGTGPTLPDSTISALPYGIQPIPIHTVPQNKDMLLLHDQEESFNFLLEKYVFTQHEWIHHENQIKSKLPRWSEAIGTPLKNLYDLSWLGDILFIDKLYHVAMPKGLSEDDVNEIISEGKWSFVHAYAPKSVSTPIGKNLLKNIATAISKASQGKSRVKYILYSAHDSTILTLMSIMGVPLTKAPPYASDINFLVFVDDNQNRYIKITYNNEPVSLPACGGTRCSIEQFVSLSL